MRRFAVALSLALAFACGGDGVTPPITKKPKPDPYITIRVTNTLDTTSAPGRTGWRLYVLLSGPYANQNGISPQGTLSLEDVRLGQRFRCIAVGADSVDQRMVAPLAIGDTATGVLHSPATYDSVVARWYAGNHAAPPAGYMILTMDPRDAWQSAQYEAGHGLVPSDPIKWAWDWTARGTLSFTERAATDTTGCNQA